MWIDQIGAEKEEFEHILSENSDVFRDYESVRKAIGEILKSLDNLSDNLKSLCRGAQSKNSEIIEGSLILITKEKQKLIALVKEFDKNTGSSLFRILQQSKIID